MSKAGVDIVQLVGRRERPILTLLGTTTRRSHWQIIDKQCLEGLRDVERRFLLHSGIAHQQRGHGPVCGRGRELDAFG